MNSALIQQNSELMALSERLLQARKRGELLLQPGDLGWASAPSNIALLKYWGKKVGRVQVPMNSSLSLTLNAFRASTRVSVVGRFFPLKGNKIDHVEERPSFALSLNRRATPMPAKMELFLKTMLHGYADDIALSVESSNNFPTACGVASSAAGYAALVASVADLLNLKRFFSDAELQFWLSEWARLGSGSATRSAVLSLSPESSQVVAWELARNQELTRTLSVSTHKKFNSLGHCLLVLDASEKALGSSEGHLLAETSLFQEIRLAHYPKRFASFCDALQQGDFERIQQLSELDAFEMHAVMVSGATRLEYMNKRTARAIAQFVICRDSRNAKMLWTLDAGANPHFVFLPEARIHLAYFFDTLARDQMFSEARVFFGITDGPSVVMGETEQATDALAGREASAELRTMTLPEAALFFAGGA